MSTGIKERKEISSKDKWNVEALYASLQEWEKELTIVGRPHQKPHWPELQAFKGTFTSFAADLKKGEENLKKFLDLSFEYSKNLSRLFTYAHLRHDEDIGNEEYKKAFGMIHGLLYEYGQEMCWVEPELLSLSADVIKKYLASSLLAPYQFYLEKIYRQKPHILTEEQESLIALAGQALGSTRKAFSALNDADLKFDRIKDKDGKEYELTHATFGVYLRNPDRILRKEAFLSTYRTYLAFENSLCELINGQVQNHIFYHKARHFPSCLEAALFSFQIDPKVYHTLIQTVRKHLPVLHRYMKHRKETLGVDELHMYDLHVPLFPSAVFKYTYEEAEDMVISSVKPLGKTYQSLLEKGLKKDRWVDRYENKRKRSGAYSSGSYDTFPYILMNYQGTFQDLMTLAHEAGHSMHSLLSHMHQPYHYADYSIFVAEVASTFNEELMFYHLMEQPLSKEQKAFLINQKIEDIRSTFFRQTMFAEFELFIHEQAEKDIPLTPALLKEKYRELNLAYFGPHTHVDQDIDIEWARIPHFYYNFYVYQYATGLSAAHALCCRVREGKKGAVEDYIQFLSSGSSEDPIPLLQKAGVNMKEPLAVQSLLTHFEELVSQLFNRG